MTVAFFGSTGGCVLSALCKSLNAGINSRALVRDSHKLRTLLKAANVEDEAVDKHLTVVQGDAKSDLEAAKATINGCDTIIFGIGGKPDLSNPLRPTLDDVHVCESSIKLVLDALRSLQASTPPVLLVISTTGVDADGPRDVPWLLRPLYTWLLAVPHDDKRLMEQAVRDAARDEHLVKPVTLRASLLTDGDECPPEQVRAAAYEPSDAVCPVIGYTISRKDVGAFIFREVISTTDSPWLGKTVSVSY